MADAKGRITTARERVGQAEEGVAQLHSVLEHTEAALAVAEQVEEAAKKGRRVLKVLVVVTIIGIAIAVVMRLTRSSRQPEPTPDRPSPGEAGSASD
ncbi:MAG: hypothetical protein M9942_09735 [Microthrixaceae bacterium]|nr:hypothetical protein [Microthrixaceae bacterium]